MDGFGSRGDTHTIRLEFATKVKQAQFDAVGPALENWAFLMMFGAYREGLGAMEEFAVTPGEIYMADPCTVEQTIRAFQAPDVVFESVINFAAKVHFTVGSVASLEIV
jgi:hypothetical protein